MTKPCLLAPTTIGPFYHTLLIEDARTDSVACLERICQTNSSSGSSLSSSRSLSSSAASPSGRQRTHNHRERIPGPLWAHSNRSSRQELHWQRRSQNGAEQNSPFYPGAPTIEKRLFSFTKCASLVHAIMSYTEPTWRWGVPRRLLAQNGHYACLRACHGHVKRAGSTGRKG